MFFFVCDAALFWILMLHILNFVAPCNLQVALWNFDVHICVFVEIVCALRFRRSAGSVLANWQLSAMVPTPKT